MRPTRQLLGAIAIVAAAATLAAQGAAAPAELRYKLDASRYDAQDGADYREERLFGGFRFSIPSLQLEIRGQNALLLLDLETSRELLAGEPKSALPRRGIGLPAPRRRLSPDELRARLGRTMQAIGKVPAVADDGTADRAVDLVRYLYFEGGITVVRGGVEVIRCDRLWISPLDDRIVVENAELRYQTTGRMAETMVVRGARLQKTGARWSGRDLSITTCTAAEPHLAVAVEEADIIERTGEFEVLTRGQSLQVGSVDVLPLPDAHFFTGSQSEFPIKRISAGYSSSEGINTEVVFGLPWNTTGGAIHEALTGRSAKEFRGEWELGVGWVQERGVPLGGALEYRVPGLYEGRTEAFWLDDSGANIREIVDHYDGSPIENSSRGLVRTQDRLHFGESTHFDLQAYGSTDPAVLSEFFGGDYRSAELPETSAYLHHAAGNHLFTIGARSNLDSFSYRDDRGLAERFVEELPVATWNWIAQPIGQTPWETPIVLDAATEIGQRRSDYDDRATTRIADRTTRADQKVEISAPFRFANLNFRPYAAGLGSFFDDAVDGDSEGRIAWEAGVQVGTRLSRTWEASSEDGGGLRHVIAPRFTFANRFRVDDTASEFHQFDAADALTEQNLVRFEVRNLLQQMEPADRGSGLAEPRDFLMLDLAQDLWPDAGRDNGGDELGLFYYDLLVRPRARWLPFQIFTFALYGDHDWDDGMRTLDTELRFGPLAGLTWTLDYRTDKAVDGAVGASASTQLFGRWDLVVSSLYDLQEDDFLTYGFGLRRNDHDWSIALTTGYDPFTDETSLRLEFQPRFGGLTSHRGDRFGGSRLHDTGYATNY